MIVAHLNMVAGLVFPVGETDRQHHHHSRLLRCFPSSPASPGLTAGCRRCCSSSLTLSISLFSPASLSLSIDRSASTVADQHFHRRLPSFKPLAITAEPSPAPMVIATAAVRSRCRCRLHSPPIVGCCFVFAGVAITGCRCSVYFPSHKSFCSTTPNHHLCRNPLPPTPPVKTAAIANLVDHRRRPSCWPKHTIGQPLWLPSSSSISIFLHNHKEQTKK